MNYGYQISFLFLFSFSLLFADPINYRQEMREFVQKISAYARTKNPSFAIVPQNAQELLTKNGKADGPLSKKYIRAIDGVGREDLFFGYTKDNISTPPEEQKYMLPFLKRAQCIDLSVLVMDYCFSPKKIDRAYQKNQREGFTPFVAYRNLDRFPPYPKTVYNENLYSVNQLKEAQNFLCLLEPSSFQTKANFITQLEKTNYDLLIIDLFFDESLTKKDIKRLKEKTNGRKRLVFAYLSIGEAEDYRYYWQKKWKHSPPSWLEKENPHWAGNYKVKYWEQEWQKIIVGKNSYLERILEAKFDGVYLDIIDAFEYFENQ